MLTAVQPWFGSSIKEINHSVVIKQDKPPVPSGLPLAVENVINGCSEYDLRNRPSMEDIIHAFESSQNDVQSDGEWFGLGSRTPVGKFSSDKTLRRGKSFDIQIAYAYYVGEFVRLKANVLSPIFEWPRKGGGGAWATGRISQVLPNGCLVVRFPGRLEFGGEARSFLADSSEVELVSFDTCPRVVEKYQHAEYFNWAVRPLAIAFGLFTTMKFSLFVGRVSASLEGRRNSVRRDGQSNSGWLPPPVANLFKEGTCSATAR
ncbi:hypothetical protein M0R45_031535 [Rubus argutus]|uniref:Uncharacterized protein n=1 Tax=Rubus argutus TaxID=59490 RepID=A0AAW1WEJ8_RUBAR